MENKRTRSDNKDDKKNGINGWKWAFITIVVLLIWGFIYLASMLQPVSINEASMGPNDARDDQVVLSTSMNKQDTEMVINTYLNEAVGEDFAGYSVRLTDQLEIHGELDIFGFSVPFSLYFMPYVLENGNIQLRGESVQLASFSLPVSGVMSLLTQQMELPEFIAVDSANQIIVINLDEMTKEFTFDFQVEAIDLIEDEIRLKLHLDKEMISNGIESVN